jgi:hypothetical protein
LIEGQKTEHMLVRASPYKVPFSGGAPIMPMGVTISLHDFEFTKYPGAEIQADGGVPSKFKSTVTLEGASDRPLHDYVRVNHRIKYGGWIFHQEAYSLPNEESPDPLARELAKLDRFFIEVAERLPDGRTRAYQLENYIHPTGRTVAPLPGRDDRFLSLERSPSGEHALWTVASNEKVLARGSASLFGDLQIRMIAFLPDFAQNVNGIPYSKSDRFDNPAAFVAIASDNRVIFQEWVIANAPKPEPHLDPDGTMHEGSHDPFELALVDYELTPEIGGATGVNVPGARINGDAHDEEKSIGERVVATIALRGGGREQRFKLIQGRSIPVVGGLDSAYEIAGPFELAKLRPVPAMATILSVSKNPGVPICWAGAVMASFGPFLAFFVSRRRVWATIEENGQVWFGGESRYSRENLEDEITQVVRGWESERRIKLSPEIDLASEREREKLSRHL